MEPEWVAGTPEEAWRDNAERRYREGRRDREQEIIALLENAENHIDADREWYAGLAHAIALIKGENK